MIVCCGEALIDMLPRIGSDGAAVFQPFAGGSPFNTAIALGRLGAEAGFLGGLSDDFFGAILGKALGEAGVDTALAIRSDRPTTLAFVTLVEGNARYAFYDENSAGRMIAAADLPDLPASVAALHFAGVSLVQEPCGSAYEALIGRERGRRVISLDPNVRPSLVKDAEAYRKRVARLAAMADIVKLSEEDLEWLAPATPFETVAGRWLDAGARLAILTRGAAGALAISRAASAAVPAVAVKVADTVGAGDTFTAGLLARLAATGRLAKDGIAALSEADIADALAFAARAAAVTVSRPGADPPWLHELAG
jgi:fructokinase